MGVADRFTRGEDYRAILSEVLSDAGVEPTEAKFIGAFLPYGYLIPQKKLPQNVLLTGDAGGFTDPISGEGLYMALQTGIYAGEAVSEKSPKAKYLGSVKPLEQIVKDGSKVQKLFYTPAIHEKLLGRPRMTREDFKEGDPRIRKWDEEIVIALDGKEVTFKPTPEGCEKVNIPSKDGLVWNKNRLILPDSGIIKELDYTVREFDGKRFLFDEGFERLLAVSENNARLYPVAQYDNRFRAPFLLYRNTL